VDASANVGGAFRTVQTEHRRLIDATADFLRAANEIVGTARTVTGADDAGATFPASNPH
jgi:hypothetical protein